MIIKLRSNGILLEELSKYFIKIKNNGERVFQVSTENLNYVLNYLKNKGITKVKLSIEDIDIFIDKNNELSKKPTQLEFLEFILRDKVEILQVTKNLDKFFKSINFSDINDCYKILYDKICNISTVKEEIWLNNYKVNRNGFYYLACKELFDSDEEFKQFQNNLKKSFQEWLKKYYPEYTKYFPSGLPYTAFMRFLLKATDRKYY